jgi:hypothetical protein
MRSVYISALLAVSSSFVLVAQTEVKKPQPRVSGEVTAVDGAAHKLSIKPDNGGAATVTIADGARVMRVPPGEKDPHKFVKITAGDISVGDRVLARGQMDSDGSTIAATLVYVMAKGDVAQKAQQERTEWQTRGLTGTIASVDPASKEITISQRSREGLKVVTLAFSDKTTYRRYAPDSMSSANARPSAWTDLKVGDEVHVMGDRSADGTRVQVEQIYSGAFQTIAATVVSVDASSNTLTVSELPGKKTVTVHVKPETLLRRLPPEMAAMMAQRLHRSAEGGGEGQGAAGGTGRRNGGGETASASGSRPRGSGNFDLRQLLERMPALNLGELKPGNALILSSSKGDDPSSITAFRVVAGVEPFLAAAPRGNSGEVNLGDWSMEASAPAE